MKFLALTLLAVACFAADEAKLTYNYNQEATITFPDHEYLTSVSLTAKIPNYLSEEMTEAQIKSDKMGLADGDTMTFDNDAFNKQLRAHVTVTGNVGS